MKFYRTEWLQRGHRSEENISKNVDFSLWGNRANPKHIFWHFQVRPKSWKSHIVPILRHYLSISSMRAHLLLDSLITSVKSGSWCRVDCVDAVFACKYEQSHGLSIIKAQWGKKRNNKPRHAWWSGPSLEGAWGALPPPHFLRFC